jgi:hypothetical protein
MFQLDRHLRLDVLSAIGIFFAFDSTLLPNRPSPQGPPAPTCGSPALYNNVSGPDGKKKSSKWSP